MYEGKFPGFGQRALEEDIVDGLQNLSGINKEPLGPIENK